MRHRLTIPEPHSHLLHLELEVDRPGPEVELALPVWTPGSYLVREYARHLEGLAATDGEGRPIPVERVDKHRFRARTGGAARLVVRYRVYANELTVRTCHVDGTHAFLNGAAVFLYVPGRDKEPQLVEVEPPPGWRVSTALDGGPTRFTARDYDELADSPLEIGTHEVVQFTALGKPHELALWGRGNVDANRLADDARKIVETHATTMGGLPYDRYLFIVHLADKRRGGLEHARSTTLLVNRFGFAPRDTYEETLGLFSHEFFHVWNVKRLKPAAFVPFDYSREQYTRLLWWFEGVTSYYEGLALVRAGLVEPKRWLKTLGQALTSLERTPGAAKMSLEEASFLAWVKHYRPDENTPNSAISYYLKGELVALALDLALRRKGRSLDELLKLLYARHLERGVPEDGVERAVAELLGEDDARRFFERWVRGTERLELDLEVAGVRLRRRVAQSFDDKGGTPPKQENGRGEGGAGGAATESGSVRKAGSESVRAAGAESESVRGEPVEPRTAWLGAEPVRALGSESVRAPESESVRAAGSESVRAPGSESVRGEPVEPRTAWLGAELSNGPKLVVQSVREGSPAHRAGLYAEDEIVAEGGFRTERGPLWDRLQEAGPEGTVRLTVFRRDELVEVAVPLAPAPEDTVWLEAAGEPTVAQRTEFERWTGAKLPASGRG